MLDMFSQPEFAPGSFQPECWAWALPLSLQAVDAQSSIIPKTSQTDILKRFISLEKLDNPLQKHSLTGIADLLHVASQRHQRASLPAEAQVVWFSSTVAQAAERRTLPLHERARFSSMPRL